MSKKRLPKSLRKFIRKEKARIRREFLDIKKQEEEIKKLYSNLCVERTDQDEKIQNLKGKNRNKTENNS